MTRLVCALIVLGAALIACARVEGTNRQQLLLTSAGQENQLGSDAYAEIKQKEKLCTDAATVAWVERVARRVAAMAPERGFQYEFVVIESPTVNAFCLPGGKVAVYTGILPYCQNEAGLATVLGHEIAHAIARHGGERMSQGMVTQLGGQTLDMVLKAKGVDPTISNMALTAFGVGSQIGVMLPFSRPTWPRPAMIQPKPCYSGNVSARSAAAAARPAFSTPIPPALTAPTPSQASRLMPRPCTTPRRKNSGSEKRCRRRMRSRGRDRERGAGSGDRL